MPVCQYFCLRSRSEFLSVCSYSESDDIKIHSVHLNFSLNHFQFLDPLTPSPQSQSSRASRLRSGRLMVLDTESILIPGLDLHMSNPGYFFWTGNTTYPDGLTGQGS